MLKTRENDHKTSQSQNFTMIVFLLIYRLIALTSARYSLSTGTRHNLILKYCAALSYAECAETGIILQSLLILTIFRD